MRSYYHCSTAKYRKRKAVLLTLTGSVCAEAAVIAFIVLFFGLFASDGSFAVDTVQALLVTAAAFIVAGLLVCFISAAVCDKRSARHSRYTYLDIQLKAAVISVYSGEMRILGRNAVFRELYLIPFSELVSAEPSHGGRKLLIRGRMRRYGMESDFLGYHVRNGNIEFDRMWLEVGSFESIDFAELPAYFGDPAKISAVLAEAKKRFDEMPKPKKHDPRIGMPAARRPLRRVNPAEYGFGRTWK